ncbi:MAG: iron-containing redox enzyme family protein [Pseudomonadota bacterium]|nr:iron-containing redox enzyme family protein [Pseudomonadota bacterium]
MSNKYGKQTAEGIVAIRETWHTKDHPFYIGFSEGEIGLKQMAALMAQHYQHVLRALPSFGIIYYKSPPEAREFILENLAEEEGLVAGPGEDREPHDHMELIFRFCRAAGMTEDEVKTTEQLPAWRARSYYYLNVVHDMPIGVILAMQCTQEGQQPAINGERTLPAFQKFHGYTLQSPEIEFFTEHYIADADHSSRQLQLVEKLITSPELRDQAMEVAETQVKTRWACMNDIYRATVLGYQDPMPDKVPA